MKEDALDVYFSAQSFRESDVRGKTVVVIDILRASSTIVTALAHGARGVIPVRDMASASKISKSLNSPSYMMAGEKDGVKIEGYDLGNSPLDFTGETVGGKTIILNTTNGTKAIKRSGLAKNILIGSFLNLQTVVNYLKQIDHEAVLLCSGWRGRLSMEDLLCAGSIIYEITDGHLPTGARDGAQVAFGLYEKFRDDIEGCIKRSDYAERLRDIVHVDDITFCCRRDEMQILPVMEEGIISDYYGKTN